MLSICIEHHHYLTAPVPSGNITATIVWNLVMARYPMMRWDYTGLVAATDPFGGHYDVLPPVWAIAHTTQFTAAGWTLLPVGRGSGYLQRGGTFVSYVGPTRELTIVIEKMDANMSACQRGRRNPSQMSITAAETAKIYVGTQYDGTKFALWQSNFADRPFSASNAELFTKSTDLTVRGGALQLTILPNWAYTLSTFKHAHRGISAPPRHGQFPHSYEDDFDACPLSGMPRYIAPMSGSFDCILASGGRRGVSVRQSSPALAICDRGDVMPYAVLGDGLRTTYNVSIDFLLPHSASDKAEEGIFVGARAKGPVGSHTAMDGIFLGVNRTGWFVALTIGNITIGNERLLDGTLSAKFSSSRSWRRVSLVVNGTVARASLDGTTLFDNLPIPAPYEHHTGAVAKHIIPLGKGGYAAFGTIGYILAEFDNIAVVSS
eukprot:SAG31_NODE_4214_length_3460_cov_2.941386_3_plen_433_part_00